MRASRSRRIAAAFAIAWFCVAGAGSPRAEVALVPLVDGLPWSGVSGLIGYDGRLWFVNSVKFVNHNSADVYSFDPRSGTHRYERHLFSQDAGDPVVSDGLLYWPFEDSRWSPGRGEYMVTNGRDWRWGILPQGRAFHVHAMTRHAGALFAAPSAWKARLQRSLDGGTTWRVVYEYPAPPRTVSRIVALADLDGTLFGGVTARHDLRSPKLLRWRGERFEPVSGWPAGSSVPTLTPFRGWLYGDNVTEDGSAVWRTDGRRVERITALDGHIVRSLAAGADAIWAVTVDETGGGLWRSADGRGWDRVQKFLGPRLLDVQVYGGRVYVGARGPTGGMLLGPAAPAPVEGRAARKKLPRGRALPTEPLARSLERLDSVLADPVGYGALRSAVLPLALRDDRPTGEALARRLAHPLPDGKASMFGGRVSVSADKMARWYLMWAMAHTGHGRIDPALISEAWSQRPNRAEKYLESPPGAAWAAAELGQSDRRTLDALIARLDRAGDPDWLAGDMVGALTVLTGRRFGYNSDAWRNSPQTR